MRKLKVVNPKAGKGKYQIRDGYVTTGQGDCENYVRAQCKSDPQTHFEIFGGDGTLNEAVSGIMHAGAKETASISVFPCGSGNDTIKTLETYPKGEDFKTDLILCNGRFAINMLNIGFDCNVVKTAGELKRKLGVSGSLSYILGVVREFFRPFGESFKISATCEDGSIYNFEEPALLCAVCNGQWCGGGFHSSPLSDMRDGVLEMILVRKTGRLNFIRLIGKYRKGTHIDRAHGTVSPVCGDTVILKRIRKMTISGCRQICYDGEIMDCTQAEISVLPGAVRCFAQLPDGFLQKVS